MIFYGYICIVNRRILVAKKQELHTAKAFNITHGETTNLAAWIFKRHAEFQKGFVTLFANR